MLDSTDIKLVFDNSGCSKNFLSQLVSRQDLEGIKSVNVPGTEVPGWEPVRTEHVNYARVYLYQR